MLNNMAQFVTSTTLLDAAFGRVHPVLISSNTTSNVDHKFIERYFPRDENAVKSLFVFLKRKKRSSKLRTKERPSQNDGLLQVA